MVREREGFIGDELRSERIDCTNVYGAKKDNRYV